MATTENGTNHKMATPGGQIKMLGGFKTSILPQKMQIIQH